MNIRRKRDRTKCAFVFAVVGEYHVLGVATALQFLKRFTHAEIIVIQSRSERQAPHDQVIRVELPDALDDRQASIFLKTSLGERLKGMASCFCYLDSDVIAVHEEVDTVFEKRSGVINFALDHVNIDRFSRWAVNCGCPGGACQHLREAISNTFNVGICNGSWQLWNGGVFLFDESSEEFLVTWHQMTSVILGNPYWRTRDQGTLAATTWKLGYQDQRPLSPEFNLVVDRMWGIPEQRRPHARTADFHYRNDYSLTGERDKIAPRLIHFVNGGVGQIGWKNWDEVETLLTRPGPSLIT